MVLTKKTSFAEEAGAKARMTNPLYSAPMTRSCQDHGAFGSLLAMIVAQSQHWIVSFGISRALARAEDRLVARMSVIAD
jgi:hypothetical protein